MSYYCENCDKYWNYPIKKCIFCRNNVCEVIETKYRVIGFTEVYIPSVGNEKVPYYIYLLEDEKGNKIIQKSFDNYEIGEVIDSKERKNRNFIIGIVGTGQLGSDITDYLLRYNYPVILKTRTEENCIKVTSKIRKKLLKNNTEYQVEEYLENLRVTKNYEHMKDCDIIIETVIENVDIKKDVLKRISKICNNNAILATNTSSLSIDEMANVINRPDKFIGMHFFYPVSKMDLIEVIIGEKTSEDTQNKIIEFSKKLNKTPIIVKNSPGFVVNRLLLPQINEAVHILENGIATKEEIDTAIKLGLNHPMGPFSLADFIGIDVCIAILEAIFKGLKDEKYKPAKMLYEMANDGKLGVKSGDGFYKY